MEQPQKPKKIVVEDMPDHPDRLTDRLDKYEQIKIDEEFNGLWPQELSDVNVVGDGLARAESNGNLTDTEERGNEYTSDVEDSPADTKAAKQSAMARAALKEAATILNAAPSATPGALSGKPYVSPDMGVDERGGIKSNRPEDRQ